MTDTAADDDDLVKVQAEYGCKSAADLESIWSHWFLYGATGSGKTEAAATFPRPVFIVPQNEKSIVTLRGLPFPYFEVVDMDKTVFNPKTGVGSMQSVLDKLESGYRRNPDAFPFDTIVVESLTHYGDLIQEQLTRGGTKSMNQNDWGQFASHVRNVQARLRSLDVHAVFTALDRVESGEDGKVLIGGPHLTGQLAAKLPSSCDVIGYCDLIEGKGDSQIFRIHFRRYKHFPARSRFRGLPAKVDNFRFANIAQYLGAMEADGVVSTETEDEQ